jgi:hypothetical protein
MAKKYDESKYEVSEDMPAKFAQIIPGLGVQHFSKEHLSDNDLKALLKAKNPYVKKSSSGEHEGKEKGSEYQEDAPKKKESGRPEYKDIGAGKFPH